MDFGVKMLCHCLTHGVKSLGDDEDVVDSDAEENEGNHSVGRRVEQAEQRAETVAYDHAHGHTEADNYRHY